MEAVTLGRIIHLKMLAHESPKQALKHRSSLEVALRRLYAILYVEETYSNEEHSTKKDAWQEIEHILEATPQGSIMSDQIEDSLTKRMTLKRKRLATIKAIKDSHVPKKSPRTPNTSTGASLHSSNPDDNRHRPKHI